MENAWSSNRALLNVGRAIGDEPLLISTFRRMASGESCVRSLERALAQGEFLAPKLEERQSALDEELAVPHILIGMRGERAGTNHMLSNIESGNIPVLQTLDKLGSKNPTYKSGPWDHIQDFFAFSLILRSHANLLDMQTRTIEGLKLPPKKRNEALREIDMALKKISVDGNPLRFRRTKDGLVIYSIGREGNYDGKALDDLRNINEAVVRVEFRLWDPAQRRQPPLPAKPKDNIKAEIPD
jgi:hypothetical protein